MNPRSARHQRIKHLVTALVLTAAAPTLFGCAAPDTTGAASQDLSPFHSQATAANPVVLQARGASMLANGIPVLPLDAYDGYAQATVEYTLSRATTKIEQVCMASRGMQPPAGYANQFLPITLPGVAYYGVTSTAEAKTFGYRIPESAASGPSTGAAPSTIPAATAKAFFGAGSTGTGGCVQQAYNTLGIATVNGDFDHLNDLRSLALGQADKDSRLTKATTAWTHCMRVAGYNYPSPLAPGQDRTLLGKGLPVPEGDALAPVSPPERAAAETDVTCKQSTDYLQTYLTVIADHQQQLIASNRAPLQQILRDWHRSLTAANSALR